MEYDKKLKFYRVSLFILSFAFFSFFIYNFYSLYREWNSFYEIVIGDETKKVKSMVESTLNSGGDPIEALSSYMEMSRFLKGVRISLYGREFFVNKIKPKKPYEIKTVEVKPLEINLYFDTSFKNELNKHLIVQFSYVVIVGAVFIFLIFYVLNLYFRQLLIYEKEKHEKERLESVSVAISSVLHEVKNSLSRLNMLVYAVFKSPSDKKRLNLLKDEIVRLSHSIDKVSSVVKTVEIKRENINLRNLIESVLEEFRELTDESGIKLVVDVEDVTFSGDFEKLKEVLRNIIKNGIEALNSKDFDSKEIVIEGKKNLDKIVIKVKDSAGLLKDVSSDTLFKPFKTTKEKGFGMGLYYSMVIIKAHGGALNAYLSEDGYSTFEIVLPL